ncbi:alpha-1,3-mannosyltransferase CMT1 [Whalleya microplaca]|nr:alpha-1,3-mannosyltransferase CMT1 [Whalleya microplaca]
MRRSRLIALQVTCLFLVALTFWLGYNSFTSQSWSPGRLIGLRPHDDAVHNGVPEHVDTPGPTNTTESTSTAPEPTGAPEPDAPEPEAPGPADAPADAPESVDPDQSFNATSHIKAILDPTDATFPRLECPAPNGTRYEYLKADVNDVTPPELKYYFALDLRQSIEVIPRLLGSIVEAVQFLGPRACALSIVEGNSDDGTREVLQALRPGLEALNLTYHMATSELDPATAGSGRIVKLAQLRNQALAPLLASPPPAPSSPPVPNANTTVIFLNDVALCAEDILELVHQRAFQGADMTCAMDWTYVGRDPTFYDVWVARTLGGDLFFDIPPGGSWDSAWNLFWNDAGTKARYGAMLPFQVYACWNGAVAFGAAPVLEQEGEKKEGPGRIEFRASRDGECYAGEPTLFCKDLWWSGRGRIAVVPSVNLEYSNEAAGKIKDLKGYTSKWTERGDEEKTKIEWVDEPPDMVACMPGLGDKSWRPWNETLT